jgi:hypothetical protein
MPLRGGGGPLPSPASPYASRIVDFLDREALITRAARGPITGVDWQGS